MRAASYHEVVTMGIALSGFWCAEQDMCRGGFGWSLWFTIALQYPYYPSMLVSDMVDWTSLPMRDFLLSAPRNMCLEHNLTRRNGLT